MKTIIKILLFFLLFILALLIGSDIKAQVKVKDLIELTTLNPNTIYAAQEDSSTYYVWRKVKQSTIRSDILSYIYPILHFNPSYRLTTAGIENYAITNNKIAQDAITTDNILDETIGYWDLQDLTITNEKIRDDAVTSDKILDGTIVAQDLNQSVIDMITGEITPIPDSNKVNTTGDYLYGSYSHYGIWNEYGNYVGYGNNKFDLSGSNYLRIPLSSPSSNLFGQLYSTTGLNRGMLWRNNSNSTDTIPSLYMLRQLGVTGGLDTNYAHTTGFEHNYANNTWWGDNQFKGALQLPLSGANGKVDDIGEVWYRLSDDRFYGYLNENDSGSPFVQDYHLGLWAGSSNITTLGTITTGTWSANAIDTTKGGTAATNKTQAFKNLAPNISGNAGKYLYTDGTNISWQSVTPALFPFNYINYYFGQSEVTITLNSTEKFYSNLYIRCFPEQGGTVLENIVNAKHNQIITLMNSSATNLLILNASEGFIFLDNKFFTDEVDDTLTYLESVTLIFDSVAGIWHKFGILENKIPLGTLSDTGAVLVNRGNKYEWRKWNYGVMSIPILNPEQDDYPFTKTDREIYVDSVRIATADSSINNIQIWSGTSLDGMSENLFASAQNITNNTVGHLFTSFTKNYIPENFWIQITCGGAVGVDQEKLFVLIYYRW